MTTKDNFSVADFQGFLDQHRLVGSRCQQCGSLYVPPRAWCTKCHGTQMNSQELSGRGRLVGFTAIAVVPTAMAQQGYGRERPYLTGVVALDEGPRIAAHLANMDVSKPEKIKIGSRLVAVFQDTEHQGQKRVTLAFQPVPRRSRQR